MIDVTAYPTLYNLQWNVNLFCKLRVFYDMEGGHHAWQTHINYFTSLGVGRSAFNIHVFWGLLTLTWSYFFQKAGQLERPEMVVTLFVSAPIYCRIFAVGHSNVDKYPCLSTTNSNAVHFSNYMTEFIILCQMQGLPLLQPTPSPGYVVTQPGVNCNNKIE